MTLNPIKLLGRFVRHPMFFRFGAIGVFAAAIWFGGGLSGRLPFNGIAFRIGAIVALIALYTGAELFSRWRARRKAASLLSAVAEPGEADILKKKFEDAIAALNVASKKGGADLMALPWYVIIGPPGAGKTTALRNAGLRFPLESALGEASLKGVGGTRDCDWWFTDDAVLLDTAGRYTTQDSNVEADRAAWEAFVDLLKERRRRRPLNGVFVAVGVDVLLGLNGEDPRAHAAAIRKRILELYARLRVRPPVYVLITKLDLTPGFAEFFERFDERERAQVWGFTRAAPGDNPAGAATLADEFDREFPALVERLVDRVAPTLALERDPARCAAIAGFPERVSDVGEAVRRFLADAFAVSAFHDTILTRGVYLTSGTQTGATIDRLMSGVADALGLSPDAHRAGAHARSYFIRDALAEVAFPEQDLLGLQRKAERRALYARRAGYGATAAALVAALASWSGLYAREKSYADGVAAQLTDYAAANADAGVTPDLAAGFERAARRLERVRAIEDEARAEQPRAFIGGLGAGGAVPAEVEAAYDRELALLLTPLLKTLFEQSLAADPAQRERVFKTFKPIEFDMEPVYARAYFAMSRPKPAFRDPQAREDFRDAAAFAMSRWRANLDAEIAPYLDDWLAAARRGRISGVALNADALEGARQRLNLRRIDGAARIVYREWLAQRLRPFDRVAGDNADGEGAQSLAAAGAPFSALIQGRSARLIRRNGDPTLDGRVPTIFLAEGIETFKRDRARLSAAYATAASGGDAAAAVFYGLDAREGAERMDAARTASRFADMMTRRYFSDYAAFWRYVLAEVRVAPLEDPNRRGPYLDDLAQPDGPLKNYLSAVQNEIDLVPREDETYRNGATDEARLTREFERFVAFMGAPEAPGPVDDLLANIKILADEAYALADGLAPPAGAVDARRAVERQATAFSGDTTVAPIGEVLRVLAGVSSAGRVIGDIESVRGKWRNEVAPQCRQILNGKYPFWRGDARNQVGPADMEFLFGPNGVVTQFINEELSALVEIRSGRWRWREGVTAQRNLSDAALAQFRRARFIHDSMLRGGRLAAGFTIEPEDMSASLSRSTLEIGDEASVFSHGPRSSIRGDWPDDDLRLSVVATDGRTRERVRGSESFWFLFELLDGADWRRRSDLSLEATFNLEIGSVTYVLTALGQNNPFTAFNDWRRFRCPEDL